MRLRHTWVDLSQAITQTSSFWEITYARGNLLCRDRIPTGRDDLRTEVYTLSGTTFHGRGSTSIILKKRWRHHAISSLILLTIICPARETGVNDRVYTSVQGFLPSSIRSKWQGIYFRARFSLLISCAREISFTSIEFPREVIICAQKYIPCHKRLFTGGEVPR